MQLKSTVLEHVADNTDTLALGSVPCIPTSSTLCLMYALVDLDHDDYYNVLTSMQLWRV